MEKMSCKRPGRKGSGSGWLSDRIWKWLGHLNKNIEMQKMLLVTVLGYYFLLNLLLFWVICTSVCLFPLSSNVTWPCKQFKTLCLLFNSWSFNLTNTLNLFWLSLNWHMFKDKWSQIEINITTTTIIIIILIITIIIMVIQRSCSYITIAVLKILTATWDKNLYTRQKKIIIISIN